jgi:hypothetical protein
MAHKKWLCKFLRRGGMSIVYRIRRGTGKVIKVVSACGNQKAKSGGMGRVSVIWKDLKCVCLSVCLSVWSGLVRSVPIEFPRMCISVNPRICTYLCNPHTCISTYEFPCSTTSIGGLRRIKISHLIRSPRSVPPLFWCTNSNRVEYVLK